MRIKTLKLIVLVANLVLFASMVTAGTFSFLAVTEQGERRAPKKVKRPKAKKTLPSRVKPFNHYGPVWRLMGDSGVPLPPPPTEEGGNDESKRQAALAALEGLITIAGVVPNKTAPKKGMAILALKRNPRESVVVTVGDTFYDAVVEQIERRGVTFSYRGISGLFLLYSEQSPLASSPNRGGRGRGGSRIAGQPSSAPLRPPITGKRPGPKADPTYATFTGTKKISENNWQLDPRERDYIVQNHEKIRSEARLAPHYNRKTGKPDGVEIRGAQAKTLMHKRGFRQGDVIKSVNGVPVKGFEGLDGLVQKYRKSRSVTVTFERRGVSKTVTYKLQK